MNRGSLVLAAVVVSFGAGVVVHGLCFQPARTWPNLLLNGFYLLSLAVSGLFFLAGQRLSGARWSAGLRRLPEALMLAVPVAALLMLALYFGRQTLYTWSLDGAFAHDSLLAGRARYLTVPGVFGRAAGTFVIWTLCAWWLRRISLAQDRDPAVSLATHHRLNTTAAVFVVLFAPSFTCAAYDWLISLEPHWFSTMFAVYVFAGTFVHGIAAVTLMTVGLRRRGLLGEAAGQRQLGDLGKMLFAFSIFWAYIWVCQYLLIWYGNIPDEITYYAKRTQGPWLVLFALNFIVNWLVPFSVLLSAKAKRRPGVLAGVAGILLVGRWLDLYLMIMPARQTAPRLGIYEVAIAAGYLALAFLVVGANLRRAPLIPLNDPVLAHQRRRAAISA
ncbi:MAG TPA: hypothetical protein VFH73_25815 [Polyangia bacterium]|nr:hypothetical protein [Polyangia bacterium]